MAAERALRGKELDASLAAKAARAAGSGAEPLDHNVYKTQLVEGVVEQSLLALAA